jgi:hypothetical protein
MTGERDEPTSAEETKEPEGDGAGAASDGEPAEAPETAAKPDEGEAEAAGGGAMKPASGEPKKEEGASWARPLVRMERAWSWVESRLLFVLLLLLVTSLVFWISLRGLASPVESDNSAGLVFRAVVGAVLFGALARYATGRVKDIDESRRAIVTILALAAGALLAPLWRKVGVTRFDGILNWLQEGSSLSLFSGLRGVATRLTLLCALIGSSLAAARSKHINIDVVLRFMRPSLRKPVHVLGALATAAVCFSAAWGFFDYVSIEGFGQSKDATASDKIAAVRRGSSLHFFVLRKQLALDLRAMPAVVFSGVRWDDPSRMNGRAWNTWLDEAGFSERFSAEEVNAMRAPKDAEDAPRVPMVVLPNEGVKGLMLHDTNFMWTFGLALIGLRVLLRAVLVLAGHASVEPDAEEPDEDDEGERRTAGEGA